MIACLEGIRFLAERIFSVRPHESASKIEREPILSWWEPLGTGE
jgi:hypothetical protein